MFRFKLLASIVYAAQVNEEGIVTIDGRERIGNPGTWIVLDHHDGVSTWTDADFRAAFEPADDEAKDYFERRKK